MSIQSKYLDIIKQIDGVEKDAKSVFGDAKYASLPNIQKTVQPLLQKAGLIIKFDFPEYIDNTYKALATLIDTGDNATMEWVFSIPGDTQQKNAVQAFGSTMTYGQRYMYGVIFQIPFADEDPDGKTPAKTTPAKKADKTPAKKEEKPAADASKDDKPWLNEGTPEWDKAIDYMDGGGNIASIRQNYKVSTKCQELLEAGAHS